MFMNVHNTTALTGHSWFLRSKSDTAPQPLHPEWCPPSLTAQPCLGVDQWHRGEVGFLIELFWRGGGGGVNEAGSCFFTLTFRARLYRCPSSDLKAGYGLVGLPQRCQTSASSSAACDIFTWMEYTLHISSSGRYTRSPVFPSPHGVLWQNEQGVPWRAVSAQRASSVTHICPRWLEQEFLYQIKVSLIQRKCVKKIGGFWSKIVRNWCPSSKRNAILRRCKMLMLPFTGKVHSNFRCKPLDKKLLVSPNKIFHGLE